MSGLSSLASGWCKVRAFQRGCGAETPERCQAEAGFGSQSGFGCLEFLVIRSLVR